MRQILSPKGHDYFPNATIFGNKIAQSLVVKHSRVRSGQQFNFSLLEPLFPKLRSKIIKKFGVKSQKSSEYCQITEQNCAKRPNKIAPNNRKSAKKFGHVNYFYYLCGDF